jgi:hypothetical protein
METSAPRASKLTQARFAFPQSPLASQSSCASIHRSVLPRPKCLSQSRKTSTFTRLRSARCVETSKLEPTPRSEALRPHAASCRWCKAFPVTLRCNTRNHRNNFSHHFAPFQCPLPKQGLLVASSRSGLSRVSSNADSTRQPKPTSNLSRSQVVLQSFSNAVPAQFGLHRSTFSLSHSPKRRASGSWRLSAFALAGSNTEPNTSISLELTLSLRVISLRAAPLLRRPKDLRFQEAPLMSFSPPSALQVGQVNQREFPHPLRSVFTVGPVLTVYSLLDPAGFFHPAALLGLRGR